MSLSNYKGPIAWMAKHGVAANLLMLVLIIGGLSAVFTLKQEVFPEFALDQVVVSVPYPGATPEEVEQGILLAIEEKVRGVDGVKDVISSAQENVGTVTISLLLGADKNKVLSDIKNEVDRITSFPEEAEAPTVSLPAVTRGVISLILSGDESIETLHALAEQSRSTLLAHPDVSQVEIKGVPALELEVTVSRSVLESWGLTLDEVATQIRMASVEIGGGSLDTRKGKLLLRLSDRKINVDDFKRIPIRTSQKGTEVYLGEIAEIRQGYEDSDIQYLFEGKPAVELSVVRTGKETPTDVANAVKEHLRYLKKNLPQQIQANTWNDQSLLLQDRIDLLVKNAMMGLVLVLIVLGLFLHRNLAIWVAIGIPLSFLGAFLIMGWLGISINMITLFALIITLGMVVDDAIVVSENVFHKLQAGIPPMKAAIEGTLEMAGPVTFSVLTTVTAFAPLLFIPGVMGKIFFLIPAIVIAVLLTSLVECYFILPTHLSHDTTAPNANDQIQKTGLFARIDRIQGAANRWLENIITGHYQDLVRTAIEHKHLTMAIATGTFFVVMATIPSGIVSFTFFPQMEGDVVNASIRLPYGVALETSETVGKQLQEAERKAAIILGEDKVTGRFIKLGEAASSHGPAMKGAASGTHLISMAVSLVSSGERKFSAEEYATTWKAQLPEIPGVEALTIASTLGPSAGKAIDIQLSHPDARTLAQASQDLQTAFTNYPALTDIENSLSGGKPQLDFKLRSGAKALGINSSIVARTLRSSFQGAEALREQKGRNEQKVVVRLPENERNSESDIENLLVRTANGSWVPLGSVTDLFYSEAPTEIKRENGRRVVNVSAELTPGVSSADEMVRTLTEGPIKELLNKFPGLQSGLTGMQKEQKESFGSLGPNFLLALFIIYALLAIPFRSYIQPIIVMTAIPFGFVGAILGHLIMGYGMSFISVMGIIALSGVVVNDSLVLIDSVNHFKAKGLSSSEAVVQAGMRRFRPILLTSLTTFFGLVPMILETSLQARFLIPMAISLGFGALFVTVIVLIVIPALYMVVEGFRGNKAT